MGIHSEREALHVRGAVVPTGRAAAAGPSLEALAGDLEENRRRAVQAEQVGVTLRACDRRAGRGISRSAGVGIQRREPSLVAGAQHVMIGPVPVTRGSRLGLGQQLYSCSSVGGLSSQPPAACAGRSVCAG